MRLWVWAATLATVALAGCGGGSGGGPAEGDGELDARLAPGLGGIKGVVVDDAIRPIAGADVTLNLPEGPRATTTDASGGFEFIDVPPGTHFVEASHFLHKGGQSTATVAEGATASVRLLLARLYSQEPFSEAIKFDGFIQCGYDVGLVSSLCVNDYSTLVVPGGCCPELRTLLDDRGYVSAVGPGWRAMVFELVWEPSAQGTSEEMFVLVSHANRTASHWYGQTGGVSPVLLRLENGTAYPDQQGDPAVVPDEGQPDLYTFAGIQAGDLPVGAGISQEFQVFQHNFYHAAPPQEWSFVAGDPVPF